MELTGKVAMVTGAGSGLGEATAKLLAAQGATVAVHDVVQSRVETVCNAIRKARGNAIPLVCDVADEAAMRAAVASLARQAGRIDIVVANAGINGVRAPIDEIWPDEFDRMLAVNLRGTYLTLHLTVPHLRKAGGGSIVVISSINGTRTFTTAGASAYAASKAGKVALAKQLAVELAKSRIRVNSICPGWTRSNLGENTWSRNAKSARVPAEYPEGDIPLTGNQPAEPVDVAEAVRYLASDAARHVTGTVLYVDGAQSLLR